MTLGSLLLGLALLVLVLLFLARPFLDKRYHEETFKTERQRLLEQKEALLYEIKDLEFDYDTGKLPQEAYELMRQEMVVEAAGLLVQIDQLPTNEQLDAEIEAAVERLRQGAPVTIKATPAAANGKGGSAFCPNCGTAVDAGDKFCAHCGTSLAVPAPAATT